MDSHLPRKSDTQLHKEGIRVLAMLQAFGRGWMGGEDIEKTTMSGKTFCEAVGILIPSVIGEFWDEEELRFRKGSCN